MSTARLMTLAAALVVGAAVVLLLLGGFVTVWDSDAGEDIFILRITSSAALVYITSVVAFAAGVVAVWRVSALWVVAVCALAAALLALGNRAAVLSDSASVNDNIAVEGGTGGVSSPITRAANGPITNVDPDIIGIAWAVAAGLLIASAALAGWSMWLHRRSASA
jgi:hypothetical protein